MGSSDFYLKRGDTGPALVAALSTTSGATVDLGTVSTVDMVLLRVRDGNRAKVSGASPITKPASILGTPSDGKITWTPQDADWEDITAGEYLLEWRLTYVAGTIITVPTRGYATLTVTEDITT